MSDLLHKPSQTGTASTGQLVHRAVEQLSRLVQDELALVRAELADKTRQAKAGAGLFGSAGLMAGYGIAALLAAVILALALVMPAWLAALIVAAALLLTAGLLALLGRKHMKKASPMPTESVASLRADLDEVKKAVRR